MGKYMLIMRDTDEALAASKDIPFEQIIAAMGAYNESMMKAGVLAGGEGLTDAAEGVVVDFSSQPPVATDGPYGETKELFNGFWILDVPTIEEAVEWAKRAPLGPGSKLEVRRISGVEDFPADNEWIQKEAGWREQLGTE
ncbi:YciI family protein [Microbacterium sp. JZ70]|uniref:YciI family protein n=1 Tax=Microbacterium barkeri TaxID=33917 RepID=UPI0024AF1399|nr:YciI family protein [Microbacterium barkeri]MDI6944308.1 YciI family protein [Microbacterium barkeri]